MIKGANINLTTLLYNSLEYEYKKNRKNTVKMRLRGLLFYAKKLHVEVA